MSERTGGSEQLAADLAVTDSGRQLRRWLAVGGLFFAVALVYASIVPLEYVPLAWDEAVARFQQIPWLKLGVYRRADWVANGLVALPFGFLLAGAADRDRRLTLRYLLALLVIITLGNALIVAIEFLQLWYPRRTKSVNDIAAGCVGATVGPLAWMIIGRPAVAAWRRVRALSWTGPSSQRIAAWLTATYAVLLLAYSVLPLDLMFSVAEWREKWQAGRFDWVPELNVVSVDPQRGLLNLALALGLSCARLVPFGLLLVLAGLHRRSLLLLIGLPVLIELLQAPIFTRYTTFADVLCGWAGGMLGIIVALQLNRLRRWNDYVAVRAMTVAGVVIGILVAFLARFERLADADEIVAAWEHFWSPPFVKYYYTSEFLAGSNVLGKMIVFSLLGVALANLFARPQQRGAPSGWAARGLAAALVVALGFGVEIAQVYLVPFNADASDVLIYSSGAGIGWAGYRMFVTWSAHA